MASSDVIVIGAGPAGLAVGACLKQENVPSILLEQGPTVGSSWQRHYDRLHLHTDKRHSELPFLSYPKHYPRYPSRGQVIAYLETYARTFQLDIRFQQQVMSAWRKDDQWQVQSQDALYRGSNLVIATGYNREPVLPTWPGQNRFRGRILHSSSYKNGEPFRGQKVLVIGFGNSGGEIAIDLWEHGARPSIAVRNPVNVIPRDPLGIPFLYIGIPESKIPAKLADALNAPIVRMALGDLTKYGLRQLPYGPATQTRRDGRIPLIDVGTIKLIKEGNLPVYPAIERFMEEGVKFTDGRQANFEAVILATGFRPRVDTFLQAAGVYHEGGTPTMTGRQSAMPGLYFCGYYISPTGMLREIAKEAKQISKQIASHFRERSANN